MIPSIVSFFSTSCKPDMLPVRLRLGQKNLVSLKGRDRAQGNDLNLSQFFDELLGLDSSNHDELVIEEEMIPKILFSAT